MVWEGMRWQDIALAYLQEAANMIDLDEPIPLADIDELSAPEADRLLSELTQIYKAIPLVREWLATRVLEEHGMNTVRYGDRVYQNREDRPGRRWRVHEPASFASWAGSDIAEVATLQPRVRDLVRVAEQRGEDPQTILDTFCYKDSRGPGPEVTTLSGYTPKWMEDMKDELQ